MILEEPWIEAPVTLLAAMILCGLAEPAKPDVNQHPNVQWTPPATISKVNFEDFEKENYETTNSEGYNGFVVDTTYHHSPLLILAKH